MAEYIEKQAAIDAVHGEFDECLVWDASGLEIANEVENVLYTLPPADVRPVVLCRDCKHKGWIQEPCHGKSIDYCRILEHPVEIRFFCAAGERKELDG